MEELKLYIISMNDAKDISPLLEIWGDNCQVLNPHTVLIEEYDMSLSQIGATAGIETKVTGGIVALIDNITGAHSTETCKWIKKRRKTGRWADLSMIVWARKIGSLGQDRSLGQVAYETYCEYFQVLRPQADHSGRTYRPS